MKLPERYGKAINTRPVGRYLPPWGKSNMTMRAFQEGRWEQRDEDVRKKIARLPLFERICIRMTGHTMWPAQWRSHQVSPYLRMQRQLEHVRFHSLTSTHMHGVLERLDAAITLWPGAVHALRPRAARQAMEEMDRLLDDLRNVSLVPSTTLTPKQAQVAKRLAQGADVLTEIMKPQMALSKPSEEPETPAPPAKAFPEFAAIDFDKLAKLGVSGGLVNAIWQLKETVLSWRRIRSKIEPPSVRNQIDYLISQILTACGKLQDDPSIAGAREAQAELQEMIEMALTEIERVMQGAEKSKVDGFMSDLSALRRQIKR